jgi:hypothetical protein
MHMLTTFAMLMVAGFKRGMPPQAFHQQPQDRPHDPGGGGSWRMAELRKHMMRHHSADVRDAEPKDRSRLRNALKRERRSMRAQGMQA